VVFDNTVLEGPQAFCILQPDVQVSSFYDRVILRPVCVFSILIHIPSTPLSRFIKTSEILRSKSCLFHIFLYPFASKRCLHGGLNYLTHLEILSLLFPFLSSSISFVPLYVFVFTHSSPSIFWQPKCEMHRQGEVGEWGEIASEKSSSFFFSISEKIFSFHRLFQVMLHVWEMPNVGVTNGTGLF